MNARSNNYVLGSLSYPDITAMIDARPFGPAMHEIPAIPGSFQDSTSQIKPRANREMVSPAAHALE